MATNTRQDGLFDCFKKPGMSQSYSDAEDVSWSKNVIYHSKVSNGLPPTSYIKMIEYYLIFCLLVPCVEVLLHTVMDSLRL